MSGCSLLLMDGSEMAFIWNFSTIRSELSCLSEVEEDYDN